ncbi:MAG: hypothetical protein IKU82_06920 [Clostridia bacterium]|nr:hypothetical protein [Clostridia bacterium]
MTFALPNKTRILWQLRTGFIIAPIYALIVGFCRIYPSIVLPTAIVLSIGSVFLLIYISFYLKSYKITVDGSIFYLSKGIIFKSTVIIPNPSIAFKKSISTPLTRYLNLKCVILKIAYGWVFIPEIDCEVVERIIGTVNNE